MSAEATHEPDGSDAGHRTPWWTNSSYRLPVLLVILAGVAWYGIPRIGHPTAGRAARVCGGQAHAEPRNRAADRRFVIQDAFATGTWARSDPCDGLWYEDGRPPNARRWLSNGDPIMVDCARVAAPYTVRFTSGSRGVWSTWLHTRNGMWIPRIVGWQQPYDGFDGLRAC